LDGPTHPDVANALQRLSVILSGQSRYREAEACAARAAGIMDRQAGDKNVPETESIRIESCGNGDRPYTN
jgi:hypothetical protein